MHDIYPVTITSNRYNGAYEGGAWGAFPCYPESVPHDASGDDTSCMGWWMDNGELVGVGATPNAALADLSAKLIALVDREDSIGAACAILGFVFGRYQVVGQYSLERLKAK